MPQLAQVSSRLTEEREPIPSPAAVSEAPGASALDELKIPGNDKELNRLLRRERSRMNSMAQAAAQIEDYLKDKKLNEFSANYASAPEALVLGLAAGIAVGIVGGALGALFTWSLMKGLIFGGAAFGLSAVWGMVSAAVIKVKDFFSSKNRDPRYYFRQVMFRAVESGLEPDEQIRLIRESVTILGDEEKKLRPVVERLSGAAREQSWKKRDKILDEITDLVK